MARLQALIVATRDLRRAAGVPRKRSCADPGAHLGNHRRPAAREQHHHRAAWPSFNNGIPSRASPRAAILRTNPEFDVTVLFEKQIDVAVERERLTKELARLEKEQANADRQLGNEAFLGKAPAAVVDGLRKRAAELAILIPKTRTSLDRL